MPTAKRRGMTLSQWEHAAIEEVELVSGAGVAKVRPCDMEDLLISGRVPEQLRSVARKFYSPGIQPGDLDIKELTEYRQWKCWLIAECLEEPQVTAEQVGSPKFPSGDREQLFQIVSHALLPQKIGLASLSNFRGLARGAEASGNGEGPGAPAE